MARQFDVVIEQDEEGMYVASVPQLPVADIVIDPPEIAQTHNWLGFADIEAPGVPMIQREQQFAEKIHAYTLPRQVPRTAE
jgi:hypothetical protein